MIDTDLGRTAATTDGRLGFQQMVAQVALHEVGIIIAYDATRLARNCSHWYQLLDLCGAAGCLIADRDGVYDPGSINGRLLLGLKGQISELELHTIRARLTVALLNKARRGELAVLPVCLAAHGTHPCARLPRLLARCESDPGQTGHEGARSHEAVQAASETTAATCEPDVKFTQEHSFAAPMSAATWFPLAMTGGSRCAVQRSRCVGDSIR